MINNFIYPIQYTKIKHLFSEPQDKLLDPATVVGEGSLDMQKSLALFQA